VEDTTFLKGTEESQIIRSKCKEVILGDNREYWTTKKAKEKQLARYCGDIGVKMEDDNPCERCVCAGQDCLVYNSR